MGRRGQVAPNQALQRTPARSGGRLLGVPLGAGAAELGRSATGGFSHLSELWDVIVVWATQPTPVSVAGGFVACAVVFGSLEWCFGSPRPRRRDVRTLATDITFWAVTPLVTKTITYAVLAVVIGFLLGGSLPDTLVGRQPLWLQFLQVAALGDLIHYWTHRLFHRPTFWPMHAVHHSPTELDWLSAMRLHPLNDLATRVCQALPILAAGYDPKAVMLYVPVVVFWVILSHADLPWTFGPLRYVLVSPVFHHWHHSSEAEAIDRNFAGLFSFWDVAFGTYHMPSDRRAEQFGVSGPAPARSVLGLLWHPVAVWAGRARRRTR